MCIVSDGTTEFRIVPSVTLTPSWPGQLAEDVDEVSAASVRCNSGRMT
jgi:hypothetical protein